LRFGETTGLIVSQKRHSATQMLEPAKVF
jgi:hypothetical protein